MPIVYRIDRAGALDRERSLCEPYHLHDALSAAIAADADIIWLTAGRVHPQRERWVMSLQPTGRSLQRAAALAYLRRQSAHDFRRRRRCRRRSERIAAAFLLQAAHLQPTALMKASK
jgi:hypothetical protein